VKIRTPIVVNYRGSYVPIGTEIDLPEDEAKALTERFGEFDGDAVMTETDLESVKTLNRNNAIHGGFGNA
jgi:hypothetical protein